MEFSFFVTLIARVVMQRVRLKGILLRIDIDADHLGLLPLALGYCDEFVVVYLQKRGGRSET